MTRLRIAGRHDGLLLAGFAFALLILFERSLQYLLQVARSIEHAYGVALLPALVVLSVLLVFHLHRKRHEARSEALAAAAEAREAHARMEELERLVAFGRAIAKPRDLAGLQQVLWRHLPAFVADRECWVILSQDGEWKVLMDEADGEIRNTRDDFARLIEGALLREAPGEEEKIDGLTIGGHTCFLLEVGGRMIGMLGVRETKNPLTPAERRALGAAATLLAIGARNVQLFVEVRDGSLRDGLTGCFNRKHALETLQSELHLARRGGRPLSVLMFDLDHFKAVNDRHGHLAGDALLSAVGRQLAATLRTSDLKCRYGGDEFLVILPDTPLAGAEQVAEGLARELARLPHPAGDDSLAVTVSLGVATAGPTESEATVLISRADEALYRAKQQGRNRVCTAPAPRIVARAESGLSLVSRPASPNLDRTLGLGPWALGLASCEGATA
jgi:diguanylate cyclase (GGDEF)-like protein